MEEWKKEEVEINGVKYIKLTSPMVYTADSVVFVVPEDIPDWVDRSKIYG